MSLSSSLRRIAGAALLLWLVLTLTFVLVRLAPGDPATFLVPPDASAATAAQLRATLGLDRPLVVQYARWGASLLRGDLGTSFAQHRPVTSLLAEAIPLSAILGVASIALTFLVGVPVGLVQAARRGRATDSVLTVVTTTLYAAPSFWLALALVALFTYGATVWGAPMWLRLPAFGVHTPGTSATGLTRIADVARHAILPVVVLTAVGAAGIARYARTSAADVLGSPFVTVARAKGASERAVYFRHVLANILAPLTILFALALPGVVAGSVFVEWVFAWPGMGRLMVNAISARDYPVVLGATAVYAALVIGANLASDLLLPVVDPRQRA